MNFTIFKWDIPLWWIYTNTRKEVVSHNNSFYVEKVLPQHVSTYV